MLQALPGRGAITRVTIRTASKDAPTPAVEARVIPRPSHRVRVPTPHLDEVFGAAVPVAETVDVVLPHGHHRDSTGLVLTFADADAARAFGRAAYRASAILAQSVPASALTTVEAEAQAVDALPHVPPHPGA